MGGGEGGGAKPDEGLVKPVVRQAPPAPSEQPVMRRRLALLGLVLPEVTPPAFDYVPVVAHGGIAHVSGQLPWQDGRIEPAGKVEAEVSIEQAKEAARRCVMQALAWLDQPPLAGLDDIERVLRMTGYVASSPGFTQQPVVIDAASELLLRIFGQAGQHARSAVGVAELPRGAPVEIELTFALKRRPAGLQRGRRPGAVESRP